jgi:5-deoxy-glucuronate isomerase
MSTQSAVPIEKMVFRKTNAQSGRHLAVTPANSTMRHLSYGRIILDAANPFVSFSNGMQETGLICLAGNGTVKIAGNEYNLGQFDAIYIPRDSAIEVLTKTAVDFAEFSAVKREIPFESRSLRRRSQGPRHEIYHWEPRSRHELNVLIANNVEAGRLIAGFTSSDPGNWTSWPPHEHAQMLEEMYVYFDMPEPAYGLQLVYNDTHYPELVTAVRDGDAVLMPNGYHPNVSVPGHRIAFLWAMAAHREVEGRQFGVVNVQPEFRQIGSGLDAARK